jgi:hypothetical protein
MSPNTQKHLMGPSGIEKEHGWIFTTIVAEADGSVVLRVTPTRHLSGCVLGPARVVPDVPPVQQVGVAQVGAVCCHQALRIAEVGQVIVRPIGTSLCGYLARWLIGWRLVFELGGPAGPCLRDQDEASCRSSWVVR